jgi:hypothetical protein
MLLVQRLASSSRAMHKHVLFIAVPFVVVLNGLYARLLRTDTAGHVIYTRSPCVLRTAQLYQVCRNGSFDCMIGCFSLLTAVSALQTGTGGQFVHAKPWQQ